MRTLNHSMREEVKNLQKIQDQLEKTNKLNTLLMKEVKKLKTSGKGASLQPSSTASRRQNTTLHGTQARGSNRQHNMSLLQTGKQQEQFLIGIEDRIKGDIIENDEQVSENATMTNMILHDVV